jgi:hypothetical protein
MTARQVKPHWLHAIIPDNEPCRERYIALRARLEKAALNISSNSDGNLFGICNPDYDDLDYLLAYIEHLEENQA